MYEKVIKYFVDQGDNLMQFAGITADNFNAKKWTTKFDHEIEEGFKELLSTFPEQHSLYSEQIYTEYEEKESVWIVDPISHTINFIHGMLHFAVVAAHIRKGEVVFACVYDPTNKELFTAYKGKGAYLNDKRLHVVDRENTSNMILFNMYPVGDWTLTQNVEIYTKLAPLGYIASFASFGLNYAYVAAGRAQVAVLSNKDTFPEFAGKLLVEEAGGVLTDFHGNALTPISRGIIATTPSMHHKVMDAISSIQTP